MNLRDESFDHHEADENDPEIAQRQLEDIDHRKMTFCEVFWGAGARSGGPWGLNWCNAPSIDGNHGLFDKT
jgi:hypothetical protein